VEGRAVDATLASGQHQHDRDDWHRAERDPDAEGQDLTDRLTHGSGGLVVAGEAMWHMLHTRLGEPVVSFLTGRFV
jgi:hypothetical protein